MKTSLKTIILAVLSVISLVIICDFLFFSKEINTPVLEIKASHQNYYNAGGNSHISYAVKTEHNTFLVSKEFSEKISNNEIITYNLSPVFKQVNSYSVSNKKTETHSLRWLTGLVIPTLMLIVFIVSLKTKIRLDLLIFVISLLTVANFIYLMI